MCMKIENIVSRVSPLKEIAWFNLASLRFRDQIAPTKGNVFGI